MIGLVCPNCVLTTVLPWGSWKSSCTQFEARGMEPLSLLLVLMVSLNPLTLGWGPAHLISEDTVEIAQDPAYRALGTIFILIYTFLPYSPEETCRGWCWPCGGGPR